MRLGIASWFEVPGTSSVSVAAVEPGGISAAKAERNSPSGSLARLKVTNKLPDPSVATEPHPASVSGAPTIPERVRFHRFGLPDGSASYQRTTDSWYPPVTGSGCRFRATA